jgi:hypothetical protein
VADIAAFVPAAQYGIQAVNPAQAIVQGIQGGFGIQQEGQQLAAQQLALAQQAQLQKDLAAFSANPNPGASDYAALMTRYPQLADKFKASYDVMDSGQQKVQFQKLSPVFAALNNGKPEIASQILDTQIEGYRNSGNDAGAAGAQAMKQLIALHPHSAATTIGLQMYGADKDKFSDVLNSLSATKRTQALLPSEVAKSQADAASATVDAGVKSVSAPALAAKPGIDNAKTEQDIAKSQADARIAQFNADIAATNSDTERQRLTLERDKYVQEQAKLNQAQGQAAQDSMDSSQQALDTVGQIKSHPGMTSFFTGPGSKWGAVWGKVPGSDRQALNGWVDSLKGQLGFQNLMAAKQASPTGASGFGALSDGELKLLSGLAGQLDPNSADFPTVLGKVEKFLQKAQAKSVANPNLPTAGGAFVANSPKYGTIDEGRINKVLKAHPELTRADVLRYLQTQGQ